MSKTIKKIVDQAIKIVAQREYLQAAPKDDDGNICDGEVECLVKQAFNREASNLRVFRMASAFNDVSAYDKAIANMAAKMNNKNAGDQMRSGIRDFASATSEEDARKGVEDVMAPFNLISDRDTLKRIASAYRVLLLDWDHLSDYYEKLSIERVRPENVIGRFIAKAFDVMKEQGTLDEWKRQVGAALTSKQQQSSLKSLQNKFQL